MYWCTDTLLEAQLAQFGDKMQAKIEFTTRCNLDCIHCSAAIYRPAPDWETAQLICVLNQLLAEGYDEFHLQGGEPFIRPDIFETLDLLEKHGVAFALSTNSLLLNEEKIKRLMTYRGLATFTFSLDGATKETHNTMRGHDAFDHTLEMIHHAVKWKSKLESETRVGLNYTITKINYHEIADVISLADKLGVNYVVILTLSILGNAAKNRDILFLPEKEELMAVEKGAATLRKINIGRQIRGIDLMTFDLELFTYKWKCRLMKLSKHISSSGGRSMCNAGTGTIFVGVDGTIYPCEGSRIFIDLLERILGPYERPNISEYTIEEAKQTESFKRIVNLLHDYDRVFSSIPPCNTCRHLRKCTICPLFALADGEVKRCTEEVLSS